MPEDKVVCRTPTPGKAPTRIPAWKYDAIHEAIIKVIPKKGEGIAFKDLPALVGAKLSRADADALGSLMWHVTTVKLDMEARGELRRVEGARPQRLLRT